MATAFVRDRGRIVGALDAEEIAVVVHLLSSARDFVAPERADTGDPLMDLIAGMQEGDGTPSDPVDPALLRLLPPAHRTDRVQSAEFRALTEHSVRQHKTRTLVAAIEVLTQAEPPEVSMDDAQAQSVMVALTDVRLILGERLGLHTDEDAASLHEEVFEAMHGPSGDQGSADPVRVQQMAYYDFLSWLQESIALSLLGEEIP